MTTGAFSRRRGVAALATLAGWSGAGALGLAAPLALAAPVTGVRPQALRFPDDFGAHPGTRIEWWYVTGWLRTGPAQPLAGGVPELGFQLTFFRSRTGLAAGHPSAFAAQQLILGHLALTDLRPGRPAGLSPHRHDQRIARAGLGLAQAAEGDTAVRLDGWQLQREAAGSGAGSVYRAVLASAREGFGLDLRCASTQPLLLQGQAGYSRKGPQPEQASHYYTQPQLDARGTVQLDGQRLAVHGRAWLDHEWSDSLLGEGTVGWDWIGINRFDGSALTVFRLRDRDGGAVWAGGSLRTADGRTRAFAAGEVTWTPRRHWTSPATGARYPVEWTVETPAGRLGVRALLDAQELDSRASTGTVYWEGLSELTAPDGQRLGLGYLEMTGYAGRLAL